jgi:hypothetical protein
MAQERVKDFVFDTSELTPEDFRRFPVWMNAHWFDEDDVERKYGPFSRMLTEAARIAYDGRLPYPPLNEDDDHPSDVIVRCVAMTAGGDAFDGFLTPLKQDDDPVWLSPHVFTPKGLDTLCLGELDAAQQTIAIPLWRAGLEAAFERPLRAVFPLTLTVPAGILPPTVRTTWFLPGLMYLSGWKSQVVPFS